MLHFDRDPSFAIIAQELRKRLTVEYWVDVVLEIQRSASHKG